MKKNVLNHYRNIFWKRSSYLLCIFEVETTGLCILILRKCILILGKSEASPLYAQGTLVWTLWSSPCLPSRTRLHWMPLFSTSFFYFLSSPFWVPTALLFSLPPIPMETSPYEELFFHSNWSPFIPLPRVFLCLGHISFHRGKNLICLSLLTWTERFLLGIRDM